MTFNLKKSKTLLYADDTVDSKKGSTEIIGTKHDATLAAVASWFHKNKLPINTTKTKQMVFGKGRNLNQHKKQLIKQKLKKSFLQVRRINIRHPVELQRSY